MVALGGSSLGQGTEWPWILSMGPWGAVSSLYSRGLPVLEWPHIGRKGLGWGRGCKAREGTYVRLASDLFSLLSLKLPSESEDL